MVYFNQDQGYLTYDLTQLDSGPSGWRNTTRSQAFITTLIFGSTPTPAR